MSKGYMYILECSDGSYFTGSTKNIDGRLAEHQAGKGASHTRKRLPVKLVYFEEYPRIDQAFYREKQVYRWSRKKKEALINGFFEQLYHLAECKNDYHCSNVPYGSAQGTVGRSLSSAQGTLTRSLSGAETTSAETSRSQTTTNIKANDSDEL